MSRIFWHPVTLRVANCEGVTERRPFEEALLALRMEGEYGLPDVIFFSEVSWLDVDFIAEEWGFEAIQHGRRGSPEAGVAVAAWGGIKPLRMILGSPQTREGGGIRMRPITGGRAYGKAWRAVHAPPRRSPVARALYIARARACRGALGGDWNQLPGWMRKTCFRKYVGIGVLGVLVPRKWRVSEPKPVDIDSDHLGVDVVVWIPQKRRRRA